MSTHELKLYDRSRVTTDWSCPRKRFWQYEYNGKGIVGSNTYLELFLGTALHDGMATIATMHKAGMVVDIDLIADTAKKMVIEALLDQTSGEVSEVDFAYEQAALIEGLLRGFYKHVWPKLMAQYPNILHIEEEMVYDHSGFTFMSKPDLVVGDNDGNMWYVEYKSTSSKKENWVNSWETAVQLHSTVRAIEATTGEHVTGVIVQGLYKGFESYGKQSSPFCYGYHRNGNPPFTQAETLYEYKAGYKRYPVWEMEGGVKAWVAGMPENVLADQFPQVPPIFVKDDLVEAFFDQRAVREAEIAMAMDMLDGLDDLEVRAQILNTAFEQKFSECVPYFGKPCQYRSLCFGHGQDPLESGFQYREPHHALELEQWKDVDDAKPIN